jgi:hypothetical protein
MKADHYFQNGQTPQELFGLNYENPDNLINYILEKKCRDDFFKQWSGLNNKKCRFEDVIKPALTLPCEWKVQYFVGLGCSYLLPHLFAGEIFPADGHLINS